METIFYLSLFIIVSTVFLLLHLRRSTSSSARRLPPGPKSIPMIGSLHRLGRHPHHSLLELAKLHGPLMTLRLGSVTTIVASSPDTAKQIFKSQSHSFFDRHLPEAVTAQPDIEWTLAWTVGDRWRSLRRVCTTNLFTTHGLSSSEDLRHEKVKQLITNVAKRAVYGEAVNVGEVASATTLNLISTTLFSVDMVDPEFEKAGEFKDLVWRIMEDSGRLNLSDYFPALKRFDLQGIRRHIKRSYTRLHEILDEIILKRVEERSAAGVLRHDFLDVLLDHCVDGSDFTTQNLKPIFLDLFIAGSDTTSITTEWAMAELLKNPDVMRKAKQEVGGVMGKEQEVAREWQLEKLPYLEAIFKETLRLHPPAPFLLPYKAISNGAVISGYTIPKGARVVINAWALGRQESHWDDPTSFRPERFLQQQQGAGGAVDYKGRDFEFIPFGAGRRVCPGLPLGVRMVQLMLASLIHSFDWEVPKVLDMEEQWGTTLKKAVPLCAIPKHASF